MKKVGSGYRERKLKWGEYVSKLVELCDLATPYAPMAVLVRRWDDLRKWLFRRFPHQWIVKAWEWAKAVTPEYHRLLLFLYVLQIYPARGALPDLTEPLTNVDEIEMHQRGLENAPPSQTIPDPAKQVVSMIKNTHLEALGDFDNQYTVGPTDPIILTGLKGQLYGGHQNQK